jgi:uncharacterized protein (UPF0335 family)
MENNQAAKKFKTKAEYVEMLKREFYQIESIMETVSEIKAEMKEAGFDAALLVKVAKALAESRADEVIEKNEIFADTVEEVRSSY